MDKLLLLLVNYCCIGSFLLYSVHVVQSVHVHGKEATRLSCNQTPYPQVCRHYIDESSTTTNTLSSTSSSSSSSSSSSYSFHDMALKATMEQAIRAHKLMSSMEFKEQKAKLAWEDCVEVYEDTIYQLNRSLRTNNVKDKLTWQSASIANHETCKNGFNEFNLLFPSHQMLSNFSKLLTNSLSVSNTMMMMMKTKTAGSGSGTRRRRLLLQNAGDDGLFPSWVSASDRRKLLQATAPKGDIVVAKDGSGDYQTISEGVAAAAKMSGGGKRRVVVHVKAGVYKENVDIKKTLKNIMIIGDGIDATLVTGSRSAQGGSTTFRSATFAVSGEGFIARDITFENTAGPQNHQAVALRSGADHSVFYRCSFKGYQDTLYVYAQRQFYRECDMYGTVDFIFGDAVAVLQNCNIYARKPMGNQQNTVTAQGRTDPNENTGIVLHNCHISGAQGSFKTFLGRPWQKYSRVVVMKSALDGLIHPQGWAPWSGSFALSTLYYAEYMNTGPGANTAGRVKWPGFHLIKDPSEAVKFSVADFLAGDSWIPATGVPFLAGL